MKTGNWFFAALIMTILVPPLRATIWRVDNRTGSPGDFTTLQVANDTSVVTSGDTLHVYGSGASYGPLTATKALIMIGPGYFLGENPETQAYSTPAQGDIITFSTGSEGSMLMGMSPQQIIINVNNIVVKRVHIDRSSMSPCILITTASNVFVQQSYLVNSYSNMSVETIELTGTASNIVIANNYMKAYNGNGNAITGVVEATLEVSQNVMYGDLDVYNATVQNNILGSGNVYANTGNSFQGNLCTGTQFDTTGGNLQYVDMGTVFVGTGSTDGQWQLAADSPAIGAGVDGVDAGMFAGYGPYVLSGVPAIPALYFLNSPASGSPAAGLQVHVKAKSRN
ncbi:MAG: hypothetical protein V3W14_10770 [Candidatus Neomarinimicrobiota bacterium]